MIKQTMIIIMVLLANCGRNFKNSFVEISDLPSDFSEAACKTINEFIEDTRNLNHEIVVYFDYKTGDVIKKSKGGSDSVKIEFEDGEFEGMNIASIHNHTKDLLSPPSGRNFGIFERDFEDYELIAADNELWILEAKGRFDGLILSFRNYSIVLHDSLMSFCSRHYSGNKIYDKVEKFYGERLSEYINNKNIENLKLKKVRYKV